MNYNCISPELTFWVFLRLCDEAFFLCVFVFSCKDIQEKCENFVDRVVNNSPCNTASLTVSKSLVVQ